MEFNRNHYMLAGMLILLIGIQLRMVDSYVLNEKASTFVNQKLNINQTAAEQAGQYLRALGPSPRKVVRPPSWLGWALMSVGSVLILHSLAMSKPSG